MPSAVIVSVVWFTSTSRPRDQICEPYTLPHDDQRFQDALKIVDTQVAEATQLRFSAGAMNQIAAGNTDTLIF